MRLHDYIDYRAREHPDEEFAVQGDRRMTYREAAAEVNRVANALIGAGLQLGDRIVVLSKNSIEYAVLYYACSKAGVAPVPLNYRLAAPEWAYIVNDSGAKLLIAADEYVNAVDGIRSELGNVERFVAFGDAGMEGWDGYRQFVAGQPETAPERAREVSEDDDAYQMYTSGTTGRPKGAVLTHSAVRAQLSQVTMLIQAAPGQRGLIVVPMYHAAGAVTTFVTVYWGGCLYIQADFDPFECVRALDEERVVTTTLVPAMIQAMLVHVPDIGKREFKDLRQITYGASPIAEETLRRAMDLFKCDFAQAYGMTETTAVLTYLFPDDHRRAVAEQPDLLLSAGRPVLGTELRIVDEDDNAVEGGTIGEIIARGPQLMRGYWNLPDESAEALRGGWMHTGDAGTMDADGYLYIQDRVKDMIVSGGENVYPRTVEEVLFQHPAVADAAVIGVPDEQWGETVKALVVLKEGEKATAEQIMDFCRGKLGGFERPRSVDFIAELPRNPTGKVLKRELREPFWKGHTRRVAGV
ncbi:MAG: long-chain-fatty-acid--CoA ligase [Chloroflexi bacterium]|nr:long-chain-fatty-acid--CoA ligase [Chloroflexota bacterium]